MDNLSEKEQKQPKLAINDFLAMERTSMANERTFLAYIRTGLTMVVPGVTGFHLADTAFLKGISLLFIPLGIIIFLIGISRFVKKRKIKKHLYHSKSS